MSCAAGISRQPLAFCPDHSGEKSPLPCASALARKRRDGGGRPAGTPARAALIGPSSRITRLTMPRAGRPVKRLVSAVWRAALALQRRAVQRAGRGLGAQQVGRADLHAGRAERQRRRDAAAHRRCRRRRSPAPARRARPAAAARSVPTCVRRCRRTGTCRGGRRPRAPCAMIASTPCASSQRASSTVVADAEHLRAPAPCTRVEQLGRGQAEMEAHHRGPELGQHVGRLGAERRAARGRPAMSPASMPNSRVVGRERGAPRRLARRDRHGRRVAEEVDVERPRGLRRGSPPARSRMRVRRRASRRAASPARRRCDTATASALPCTPAIGAWMIGSSMPRRVCNAVMRCPEKGVVMRARLLPLPLAGEGRGEGLRAVLPRFARRGVARGIAERGVGSAIHAESRQRRGRAAASRLAARHRRPRPRHRSARSPSRARRSSSSSPTATASTR